MKVSIKWRYIFSQIIMSAAIAAFMPVFYVMLSEMGYSNSAIGWYYAVFWFWSTVF